MEKFDFNEITKERVSKHPELLNLSTEELIKHITIEYHDYLKRELPIILNLMMKVLTTNCEKHPELYKLQTVFGGLKTGLESHLVKEEISLFPKLKPENDSKTLIERLEKEHGGAGDGIFKIIELTDSFKAPADASPDYILLYEKLEALIENIYMHIGTENNILFKRFS